MNDDLISRKMAIDAIIDHIREKFAQRDTPLNYISGLYKAEDIGEKGRTMTNSCGNCKYGECREEYLYPYRCKKEKAVSYSEEKWMDRVHRGYVCKKWELKKR